MSTKGRIGTARERQPVRDTLHERGSVQVDHNQIPATCRKVVGQAERPAFCIIGLILTAAKTRTIAAAQLAVMNRLAA